jgi:hypothetical protein
MSPRTIYIAVTIGCEQLRKRRSVYYHREPSNVTLEALKNEKNVDWGV